MEQYSAEGINGRHRNSPENCSIIQRARPAPSLCTPRFEHISASHSYVYFIVEQMIIGTINNDSSRSLFYKGDASSNDSDTDTDVSDDEDTSQSQANIGWAYVGSHNFTPSAWGTLSGSSFNPVLNVHPTPLLSGSLSSN